MIAISTLLQHLGRAEVSEVCLVTGERPAARVGASIRDSGDEVVSSDDLLQALFSTGGSRYVDSLGEKPAQWRTRVEGVGAVNVSATMTGDVIEARFALRDPPASATKSVPPPHSARARA